MSDSPSYPSDDDSPLSPLRPKRPKEHEIPVEQDADDIDHKRWATEPNSPGDRIAHIREKLEQVANEYAAGKLSPAQFKAIYSHYNEQRLLIEKIIANNPGSNSWKQAARSGKTAFLREHFDAQPTNYVIFLHHHKQPLMGGGSRPDMTRISGLLRALWSMEKVKVGVARIALKAPSWLVMAAGYYSVTFVTFHLEPSAGKATYVRDLHNDFERANRLFLERSKINKNLMVFPQRALLQNNIT